MTNRYRWTRTVLSLTAMFLVESAYLGAQTPATDLTVTLDHSTNLQNPVATFELRKGQKLHVDINGTSKLCFEFNQKTTKATQPDLAPGEPLPTKDTASFDIVHDGETAKYSIEAKKRADASEKCKTDVFPKLSEHTWEIQVATYGWTLGFAGAFTIDKLTDPAFSLQPSTQNDASGKPVSGFTVSVDNNAESRYKLGAAAMVHLYHSDPNFLGRNGIAWAPISFGLGVEDNSQARYFLGTSVRFDTRLFLTAGRVFGSVSRLPNGLNTGSFTMDSNALGTLGSRTKDAWFIGLSYTFIDVGMDRFRAPFKQTNPPPNTTP